MTSRDDFIAHLIAALKENETLASEENSTVDLFGRGAASGDAASVQFLSLAGHSVGGSSSAPHAKARAAYEALQYDFPVVDDEELYALADLYRLIVENRAELADAQQFPVTTKMVDAIEYLNDSMNKRRGTEASALLASALLLIVPRFCVEYPDSDVSAALLQSLRPPAVRVAAISTEEQQSKIEQYVKGSAETTRDEDVEKEEFSGGFVEIYADEEDPDDLTLVYEGDAPVQRNASHHHAANGNESRPREMPARHEQLRFLATKTYSTCFSLVSSEKWIDWKIDDALCELTRRLVEKEDASDSGCQRMYGTDGEWQRYLFVLRDHLLRFADTSDACAGGIAKLKSLIEDGRDIAAAAMAENQSSDPFFSFTKTKIAPSSADSVTTQRVRVVFRVFAELAVSKEFNSLAARRSQHSLAVTIQKLFPTILQQLQALAPLVSSATFEADHGDFVIVLLQLLHFVVDAAGMTATSQRLAIDKLHDSGLLRAWLSFLPPVEATHDWLWLAPLLRLFGESALWNADFASYVHRVPKVTKLLETAQDDATLLQSESLLLAIAAHQQSVSLPSTAAATVWTRFTSERIFPRECGSFLESMQKMSDTLFLLDVLAKSISTLRAPVADELRASLQTVYGSRFTTAFQYPTFAVPIAADESVESLNKDEPEPPPQENGSIEEQKADETEERGRAEALQFLALRNRLRQCAKAILLSRLTGDSSSKLD